MTLLPLPACGERVGVRGKSLPCKGRVRAHSARGWGYSVPAGCLARRIVLDRDMPMDVEAEIRDLKRRVSEIEGSFGFLTEQVKSVHKDLLRFEEKTDRKLKEHDGRFDRLETKIDSVDRKIDTKVDGLAKDLPGIVGNEVREAFREERERKR